MPKFIDFEQEYEAKQEAWRQSPGGKKHAEADAEHCKSVAKLWVDPKKPPFKGVLWNRRKKCWAWPEPSPAVRRKLNEQRREDRSRRRVWADVESRIPPGWGRVVSCDQGWKGIILNLTRDLDRLWDGFARHLGRDCWVPLQVKEKFGGLRYYVEPGFRLGPGDSKGLHDEAAWRWRLQNLLINEAESESYRTCEQCGTKLGGVARRSVGGWIGTVCPAHYREWLLGRFKEEKKRNPKFEIHELMDETEKKAVAAKANFKTAMKVRKP